MKKHLITIIIILFLASCRDEITSPQNTSRYHVPRYNLVKLGSTTYTLHFPLDSTTLSQIESVHAFTYQGHEYLTFYDERSESINFHDFESRNDKKRSGSRSY